MAHQSKHVAIASALTVDHHHAYQADGTTHPLEDMHKTATYSKLTGWLHTNFNSSGQAQIWFITWKSCQLKLTWQSGVSTIQPIALAALALPKSQIATMMAITNGLEIHAKLLWDLENGSQNLESHRSNCESWQACKSPTSMYNP